MATKRSLLLAGLGSLVAVVSGGAMTQEASAQEIKVGVVLPYPALAPNSPSKWTAAWSFISSSIPIR
jgi:hypothetical protein